MGFEGKDDTMSNDLVVLIVMIVLLVGGGLLLNLQIRRTERKDKLEGEHREVRGCRGRAEERGLAFDDARDSRRRSPIHGAPSLCGAFQASAIPLPCYHEASNERSSQSG